MKIKTAMILLTLTASPASGQTIKELVAIWGTQTNDVKSGEIRYRAFRTGQNYLSDEVSSDALSEFWENWDTSDSGEGIRKLVRFVGNDKLRASAAERPWADVELIWDGGNYRCTTDYNNSSSRDVHVRDSRGDIVFRKQNRQIQLFGGRATRGLTTFRDLHYLPNERVTKVVTQFGKKKDLDIEAEIGTDKVLLTVSLAGEVFEKRGTAQRRGCSPFAAGQIHSPSQWAVSAARSHRC